jgi:hypothetical protein
MRTVHIEVNVDEEPVAGKPHGGFCEGLPLFFKVLEVQLYYLINAKFAENAKKILKLCGAQRTLRLCVI